MLEGSDYASLLFLCVFERKRMKQLLINAIAIVVLALVIPGKALAAGSGYFPAMPAQTTPTPVVQGPMVAAPACTTPATPVMTVSSPDGYTVTETSPGIWTLVFTSFNQSSASWVVSWTSSAGATGYDFEVSDSPTTNPTTGQFVSPIAADHVSGPQTTSNTMQMGPEEVYYFHVKAIGSGSCTGSYSPVEQINNTLNEPLSLVRHNDTGAKGLQLLALAALLGAAYVVANRSYRLKSTV